MEAQLIDTLHQPDYTGENRCEPCAVINLVLASLLSSVIARKSRIGGFTTFILSLGLIYLRGYLISGTPTLTKQYLLSEILQWFGKELQVVTRSGLGDTSESTAGADKSSSETSVTSPQGEVEEIEPHEYFLTESILEPCEDRHDLCLSDDFRTEWDDRIANLAGKDLDASEAVSVLGVEIDAEDVKVKQYGDAWILVADSQSIGQWPSQGALLADVGAARVLEGRSNQWNNLIPAQRRQILNGLRLFLEQCPGGTGLVSTNQETVESCCSSHEVITVSCNETGDRLFEQQLTIINILYQFIIRSSAGNF